MILTISIGGGVNVDSEYIGFFEKLPISAQITIKILVPSKYAVLDTSLFSCVCIQHSVLKRVVVENLKQCADKVVNNMLKPSGKTKKMSELSDIELTDEFKYLIRNFNYLCSNYSETISTEIVTTYLSYMLVTSERLKSYKFFSDCLYQKNRQLIINGILEELTQTLDIQMDETLMQFGKYLMTPIKLCEYKCYERDSEIKSIVDILCRMTKNNVMVVGQPGVGKTCVVLGVCNYLQSKDCPDCLKGFSVFSLNVNKVISGTKYRGDMEKRVDDILKALEKCDKTILFIDEIHTLFNKPSGEDSSESIQNILKPYLSGRSMVIGCTTNNEYRIIEKDKAFERRFSAVHISELSKDSTYLTMLDMKHDYEEFHNIEIPNDICRYSVYMCETYIKNRYFPDKAFDVIDGACVVCKTDNRTELSELDVNKYVSVVSGVKLSAITLDDVDACEKKVRENVFGQDDAIKTVFDALRRYTVGVNDKKKPIASFLFVGPTGVGKTELCRQLADQLFSRESFIRLDMSEYMESHSVSKIIGSPPGYVGYRSSGTLLEKVKHNPFSIILFDEVEKAHPDVLNILLQIMDDGRLTDATGDTINFCNCIICMTSNIGCSDVTNHGRLGFTNGIKDTRINDAVSKYFAPEFLGRLDAVCIFNPMSDDMYSKIFNKELMDFTSRYKDSCSLDIQLTNESIEFLKQSCRENKYGVRVLRKKIRDSLEQLCLDAVKRNLCELLIDTEGDMLYEKSR